MRKRNRLKAEVVDVLDGRTLVVSVEGDAFQVVLAGIVFPQHDYRALRDARELLEDLTKGRRFQMEVYREVDELKYVDLISINGDSLTELLLKKGLARYNPEGIGYVNMLIEAENLARQYKKGIWMDNRALYQGFGYGAKGGFDIGSNQRMVDHYSGAEKA